MTLLVGNQHFTGYTPIGPTSIDGGYCPIVPFIAPTGGQATSLYAWIAPGTATTFVMGLYDGVNQRLIYSAPVVVSTAGLIQFPIPPVPIVALRAYQLLLISNAGTFQFGVDATLPTNTLAITNANANFPQAPLALSTVVPSIFQSPAFYVDGDAQALTISPSGTVGQTLFDTATLISRAFNRCRLRSAVISDEMVSNAKEELFLLLSHLANGPTPLWAIDLLLLPFTQGLSGFTMPIGTVDVKQVNYRTLNPLQVSASPSYNPTTATAIDTVAITWSGPAVPIQVQMNVNGTWITIESTEVNASAGQTTFFNLDGGIPAASWQVIANPVPTGNVLEVSSVGFYITLSEVQMASFSRDDWANTSRISFPGTPRQYWFERVVPAPVIHFWPTPQINDQTNACAVVYRHRQIMDVGDLTDLLEVPQRWYLAIVDLLAEAIGRSFPDVDPSILPVLQTYALKSLKEAREEEREAAPMRIQPQIARYTR